MDYLNLIVLTQQILFLLLLSYTYNVFYFNCLIGSQSYNYLSVSYAEIQCSNGMVHKECGKSCLPDCKNAKTVCSDTTCIDGCFCPSGQVLHNGHCISNYQCPCYHENKEYHNQESFKRDCNTW